MFLLCQTVSLRRYYICHHIQEVIEALRKVPAIWKSCRIHNLCFSFLFYDSTSELHDKYLFHIYPHIYTVFLLWRYATHNSSPLLVPKILVKHHKRRVALNHLPFYNMAKEKKFLENKLIIN